MRIARWILVVHARVFLSDQSWTRFFLFVQESSESEAEVDKLEDDQVDDESDSEEGNKCDGWCA